MFEYKVPGDHPTDRSSLMQHRGFLGLHRKRLDEAGMALLEPGEQLIGTFDAITSHPSVRETSITFLAMGFWLPFIGLTNGDVGAFLGPALVIGALGLVGVVFCKLTGSHWVMFAITTQGLVKYRLDLLGRPRSVLSRSPAAPPEVLQSPLRWRRIALGDTQVWVRFRLDSFLVRMGEGSVDLPDDRSRRGAERRVAWWTATGVFIALTALVGLAAWAIR